MQNKKTETSTSIRINYDAKKMLDKFKIIKRESYSDVILRICSKLKKMEEIQNGRVND